MAARKESRIKKNHRDAIQTTMIRKRLEDHILSDPEKPLLTPSQVTAALGLLKKTIPDTVAQELTTHTNGPKDVCDMTDEELAVAIAQGDNVKAIG